jgi:hypothetical protein
MKCGFIAILAMLMAGCTASDWRARQEDRVDIEYDKFQRVTSVIAMPPLYIDEGDHITTWRKTNITMSALLDGEKIYTPKVVTLGVYADCPVKEGWQYLNARQLIFIADNENIDCGRGDYSPRLSGDLVEEIRYVVPIEAAKKIATAKTLEGRIGGREFTLTHAQRRLFRLFIATFPGFEALKNEPLQARE